MDILAIKKYLKEHDNDLPFTSQWSFDTLCYPGNSEFHGHLKIIQNLVGLYDYSYQLCPLCSKDLRFSKTEVSLKIYSLLQGHLLVGLVLSALTEDISVCNGKNLSRHHNLIYARNTLRTSLRYPFDLRNDLTSIKNLMKVHYALSIIDEKVFLDNWSNWYKTTCEDLRTTTRTSYKRIANQVRTLLKSVDQV